MTETQHTANTIELPTQLENEIKAMRDKHIQELFELKNEISQLKINFQNKVLQTDQETSNKLEELKARLEKKNQKEIDLQRKLITDSYELRLQHTNNEAERKMKKLESKFHEDLCAVSIGHEKEIANLKTQSDAHLLEVRQHEHEKYNDLLRQYNHQKEIIEGAKAYGLSKVKAAPSQSQSHSHTSAGSSSSLSNEELIIHEMKFSKDKYNELLSRYNHVVSVNKDLKDENNELKALWLEQQPRVQDQDQVCVTPIKSPTGPLSLSVLAASASQSRLPLQQNGYSHSHSPSRLLRSVDDELWVESRSSRYRLSSSPRYSAPPQSLSPRYSSQQRQQQSRSGKSTKAANTTHNMKSRSDGGLLSNSGSRSLSSSSGDCRPLSRGSSRA